MHKLLLIILITGLLLIPTTGCDDIAKLGDTVSEWFSSDNPPEETTPQTTENTDTPATTKSITPTAIITTSTTIANYELIFNEYRQANGCSPLIFTDDLNRVAAQRLKEIQVEFRHPTQQEKPNWHLGEIIVMGIRNNQEALECWQGSLGHNANMLDASYKYTGYAIGNGYAVQVFTEWETINGVPQLPAGWYWPD